MKSSKICINTFSQLLSEAEDEYVSDQAVDLCQSLNSAVSLRSLSQSRQSFRVYFNIRIGYFMCTCDITSHSLFGKLAGSILKKKG